MPSWPVPVFSDDTDTAAMVARFGAIFAVILKSELALLPPADAEIVAVIDELVRLVFTVNVAVDEPAGTRTVDGTDAVLLVLANATVVPLPLAGPVRVTVAVLLSPAITEAGLRAREATGTATGVTVKAPVLVTPPQDAEIVRVTGVLTCDVVTLNVPTVAPAGTVKLAGTMPMLESLLPS